MSTYLYGEPAVIITADGITPIPKCIPEEIATAIDSADVFFIYQNRGIDRLKKEIEYRHKELVEKRHELKFVCAVRILIVYLELELKKLEDEEEKAKMPPGMIRDYLESELEQVQKEEDEEAAKKALKEVITPVEEEEEYEISITDYKKDPPVPTCPSTMDGYKLTEDDEKVPSQMVREESEKDDQ